MKSEEAGDASSSSLATSAATQNEQEEDELETYLLLLLSDSNLPTGGFVASSGLESFYAHGLLHNARPTSDLTRYGQTTSPLVTRKGPTIAPSQAQLSSATLSFAQSTLHSYARSSFGYIARVHTVVARYLDQGVDARRNSSEPAQQHDGKQNEDKRLAECLETIAKLDYSYHTLLLNHVARRASKAQGIALLTLYSKAFAKPVNLQHEAYKPMLSPPSQHNRPSPESHDSAHASRIDLAATLVDRMKLDIRRAAARSATAEEQMQGHLPVCWAVFAACLGVGLKKSVFLHLFLQARSLFSSSIRLNTLGPYLAHQVMRFQMRPVVQAILREMERQGCLEIDIVSMCNSRSKHDAEAQDEQMRIDDDSQTKDHVSAYTIADQPNTATTSPSAKSFRTTATMSSSPITALRPKVQPLRTGKGQLIPVNDDDPTQGWAWDWPEDQDDFFCARYQPRTNLTNNTPNAANSERGFWTQTWAPATTFPLGEIIQARHDQLHSRLFNS